MTRESSNSGGAGRGSGTRDNDAWLSSQNRARRGADSDEADDDVVDEASTAVDVRVAVLELQASIAFFLASALLVPSSSFVRAVASCLLLLHMVPEMCVDFSESLPPRTVAHGKYLATHTDGESGTGGCCQRPRRWNQAQSLIFAAASLAQALAYGFLLQINREGWALDAYLVLILAATALWMASGLLVVASCAATPTASRRTAGSRRGCGGLVLAGNVLYLLGCVCWLLAAVNQYHNYNDAFLGGFLQQLAAGLWAAAALLFGASDGARLCGNGRGRTKRQRLGPSGATLDDGARQHRERAGGGAREDPVQETSSSSGDDGA